MRPQPAHSIGGWEFYIFRKDTMLDFFRYYKTPPKVQLSLVCASVRSHAWIMRTYNSIVTDLSFELILTGPNVPDQPLPPNVRHIYATVKPTQCYAISMFHAVGETWALCADDITFSPYAWDNAYRIYKESNNYKTMVSLQYMQEERGNQNSMARGALGFDIPASIALVNRRFFFEVGGFHRHYTRNDFEKDFYLSALYNGGMTKYSKGELYERLDCFKGVSLVADIERERFNWKDNHGRLERVMPPVSFDFNDTIYTINQGTVDARWKVDTNTPERI
jgi:hypothetical protein